MLCLAKNILRPVSREKCFIVASESKNKIRERGCGEGFALVITAIGGGNDGSHDDNRR